METLQKVSSFHWYPSIYAPSPPLFLHGLVFPRKPMGVWKHFSSNNGNSPVSGEVFVSETTLSTTRRIPSFEICYLMHTRFVFITHVRPRIYCRLFCYLFGTPTFRILLNRWASRVVGARKRKERGVDGIGPSQEHNKCLMVRLHTQ